MASTRFAAALTLAIVIGCGSSASGNDLFTPHGIAVESNGSVVVADIRDHGIWRIDSADGCRTIVSNEDTGDGPDLLYPRGIAVEASGHLVVVVVDSGLRVVVRVDPVNGDRTIISGPFPPGHALGLGGVGGIAVEASGNLVVAKAGSAFAGVLRVDLIAGQHVLLSGGPSALVQNLISLSALR